MKFSLFPCWAASDRASGSSITQVHVQFVAQAGSTAVSAPGENSSSARHRTHDVSETGKRPAFESKNVALNLEKEANFARMDALGLAAQGAVLTD